MVTLGNIARATGAAAVLACMGCGSDPGPANTDTTTGPLLPFALGNTWSYRVIDTGVETLKTTTVEEESLVGGEGYNKDRVAFHVVTRKGQGEKDKTESWQGPLDGNPETIVRYREVSFGAISGLAQLDESWDPHKLHISGANVKTGYKWLEEYKERKLDLQVSPTVPQELPQYDYWTVINEDVKVTVGETTYPHAVHLSKVSGAGSGEAKYYWYVRGVGKVREEGGQTEELINFELKDTP